MHSALKSKVSGQELLFIFLLYTSVYNEAWCMKSDGCRDGIKVPLEGHCYSKPLAISRKHFPPMLVKHTDISVIRWQNPEKWYLPLKLYGSWCANTSKPLLFFETKARKNGEPRALHFQRHLYPPPLHSKFVKITQKIVVQAFHHIFNQRAGEGGRPGVSSAHLSGQLTPICDFEALGGLLASCQVWLRKSHMEGKSQNSSSPPSWPWWLWLCLLYGPRSQLDHCGLISATWYQSLVSENAPSPFGPSCIPGERGWGWGWVGPSSC